MDLSRQPTCPVCRGALLPEDEDNSDDETYSGEDPFELSYRERRGAHPVEIAERIITDRRSLPDPTEWYVASDEEQASRHVQPAFPNMHWSELLNHVQDEVEHSLDMLDSSMSDYFEDSAPQLRGPLAQAIPLKHSTELIQRQQLYRFNDESIRFLWAATRVFGVRRWYCLLLAAQEPLRAIAIWLPLHDGIIPVRNEAELQDYLSGDLESDRCYQKLVKNRFSKGLVQMPLPTRLLLTHTSWLTPDQHPAWSHAVALEHIAEDEGVTHWALVLIPDRHSSEFFTGVWAVPWPRHSIKDGFSALTYPGWTRRGKHSVVEGGWAKERAELCLEGFLKDSLVAFENFVALNPSIEISNEGQTTVEEGENPAEVNESDSQGYMRGHTNLVMLTTDM